MFKRIFKIGFVTTAVLLCGNLQATKLSAVAYGTIVEVGKQEKDTSGSTAGGAIVGGIIGLTTGRGKSGSNKALRTIGGAAVGGAAAGAMSSGSEKVYTVDLLDGGTVRVVMDSGNFSKGDCVSVERGSTNNMRRVSSEYCVHNEDVPKEYKDEHVKEANECAAAKEELLAASDEESVKVAHMKMNILCQD